MHQILEALFLLAYIYQVNTANLNPHSYPIRNTGDNDESNDFGFDISLMSVEPDTPMFNSESEELSNRIEKPARDHVGYSSGSGSNSIEGFEDLEMDEDLKYYSGSGFGSDSEMKNSEESRISTIAKSTDETRHNRFAPLKAMCTHTRQAHHHAWWQVDLEEQKEIVSINIFNRAQGFSDRLHNVYIGVGNEPMSNNLTTATLITKKCQMIDSALPPGLTNISCEKPITGRYVIIEIAATDHAILTLCEVQVFELQGYHDGMIIPKQQNIALNKHATQSSTSWDGKAKNAVDGIVTAQYFAGMEIMSCTLNDMTESGNGAAGAQGLFYSGSKILNEDEALQGKLHENCAELHAAGYVDSGNYYIAPKVKNHAVDPFQVHCDMHTNGGGWTLILNRHYYLSHQENFLKRSEDEYVEGFGNLCLEHWLGTKKLHWLTNETDTILRIEITNSYDKDPFIEIYKSFEVDETGIVHTSGLQISNEIDSAQQSACLESGTPYRFSPGRGSWWWTPKQFANINYMGPNGNLWTGEPEPKAIEWCDYSTHFPNSKENFYIQTLLMKIRPASYKPAYNRGLTPLYDVNGLKIA